MFSEIQDYKKSLGIPYIECKCLLLIPDRWPEGVPLGVRNSLDRKKSAPFMVMKSVIELKDVVFRKHSSKLWSETQVIDPRATKLHVDITRHKYTETEMLDYLHQIGLRIKFGVPDFADRNFLRVGGRIYSIDEETKGSTVDVMNELKVNRFQLVKSWVKSLREKIIPELLESLEKTFL